MTRPIGVAEKRLLDKETAADYLSISVDTLDRLIAADKLPVVRLPVQRGQRDGSSRKVLLDVQDLDTLIERNKER